MKFSARFRWTLILAVSVVQILYYCSGMFALGSFSFDHLTFCLQSPVAFARQYIFQNQGMFAGFPLYWVRGIHLVSLLIALALAIWQIFRTSPSEPKWKGMLVIFVFLFWPAFFNFFLFPVIFLTGLDCLWDTDCL